MSLSEVTRSNHVGGMNTLAALGNLDPKFSRNLQNVRLDRDGAVSKRPGLTSLTNVAFPGGSSRVLAVIEYVNPEGEAEVFGYSNTRLARLENPYSGTGAWTTIKTGMTNDKPITDTLFNGRLLIAQKGKQPFKYFYIPRPTRPVVGAANGASATATLSTVTSGALALRDYYVKWTRESANGETKPSNGRKISIPANDVLKVSCPYLASGAVTTTDTTGINLTITGGLFITSGVRPGDLVKNITDGSTMLVTAVESEDELTGDGLTGGSDDQFDAADVVTIYENNGITGWNAYVSETEGSETEQNVSVIAVGTDWQEPDSGLISGAALPSTSTAWAVNDLYDQGIDITGGVIYAFNHRVWITDVDDAPMTVLACAVDNEEDWVTEDDALYINFSQVISVTDDMTGIRAFDRYLAFFMKNNFVMYNVPTITSGITLAQVVKGTGALSHNALVPVLDDLMIMTARGFQSMRRVLLAQTITFRSGSDNIANTIIDDIENVVDNKTINAVNLPALNIMLCSMTTNASATVTKSWVGNYYHKKKDQLAWMTDTFIDSGAAATTYAYCYTLTRAGKLLSGGDGAIYLQGETLAGAVTNSDDSNDLEFLYETPWDPLNFDDVKLLRYFKVQTTGTSFFYVDFYYDFDENTVVETLSLQANASLWDSANTAWDASLWDFVNIGRTLLPLMGRAQHVKLKFRSTAQGSLSIVYWGILFSKGGIRK